MTRRRGLTHVAVMMLGAALAWAYLRQNMVSTIEEAARVRRLLDAEQTALLLESTERLVLAERARGADPSGMGFTIPGYGVVDVHPHGRFHVIWARPENRPAVYRFR
jgi:hypothetical protein